MHNLKPSRSSVDPAERAVPVYRQLLDTLRKLAMAPSRAKGLPAPRERTVLCNEWGAALVGFTH